MDMPRTVQTIPRIRNHHHIPDVSRTPARAVSRKAFEDRHDRVTPGQTKVTIPVATPRIPHTMNSQRQLRTRLAAISRAMPPNRKATPASMATTARLPNR